MLICRTTWPGYNNATRAVPADFKAQLADTTDTYRSYLLGRVETRPDRDIWVAPAGNKAVRAIYVDRVYLVPDQQDSNAAS